MAIANGNGKIGKRVCGSEIKRLRRELAAARTPTAEEYRALQEEAVAGAEAARQQKIAELEARVLPLANDPQLMERFLQFAAEQGIVNERSGSLSIFLTVTSCLNRRKAMSPAAVGGGPGQLRA